MSAAGNPARGFRVPRPATLVGPGFHARPRLAPVDPVVDRAIGALDRPEMREEVDEGWVDDPPRRAAPPVAPLRTAHGTGPTVVGALRRRSSRIPVRPTPSTLFAAFGAREAGDLEDRVTRPVPRVAIPLRARAIAPSRPPVAPIVPPPVAPVADERPRPVAPVDLEAIALPARRGLLRRMWSGERLMHHNRLVALTLAINLWLLEIGFRGIADRSGALLDGAAPAMRAMSLMVVGNLAIAICIRQPYVVNLLFWLATRVPTSWPLLIRRHCAKVYHFGGVHVGCAIAATAWYLGFAIHLAWNHVALGVSAATLAIVAAQAALLCTIATMSMPKVRAEHHDRFERVKRFGGWSSLLLFWAQLVSLSADRTTGSLGRALLGSPEVWTLAIVTFSVALPWLRLRKVPIHIVTPSSQVALATFDHGMRPFAGSSTAISRSPLTEWHSFANVPWPDRDGFRLTISRAGDWTGKLIDDKPTHVWVKGIPTAGVANVEVLFKKVVYVAIGGGIGPCLPHLLAGLVPSRLVWATRDARKTYGDPLVDEILAVQPDALIWDTQASGQPDLVKLAYQAVKESDAEAVICIADKQVTWQVVSGMESRGIPAYGAIWDS